MEAAESNKKRKNSTMEPPPPRGIVELNVGGQVFSTTRETLLQHNSSYFHHLLEQNEKFSISGAQTDASGKIFIDRDPGTFSLILEYLRFTLEIDCLSETKMRQLSKEALYYDLQGLQDQLERRMRSNLAYDPAHLSPNDMRVRTQAKETREMLKEGNISPEQVDDLLIDLFPSDEERAISTLFDEPPSSAKATILFDKQVEVARSKNESFCNPASSLSEFQERLVDFAGPLMKNFPMKNLAIAGGAVLRCLQGTHVTQQVGSEDQSDIDLFLISNNEASARETIDRVLKHLSRRTVDRQVIPHNQLLVVRSAYAVTFCVGYPQRHLQLILRLNQCVGDVIFNFDIDCCQVAFDGRRIVATPSAYRALKTGINIADPEQRGPNGDYEFRLAKFADRGFLVAVPGLDKTKIKKEFIRNNCYCFYNGQLQRLALDFSREQERPSVTVESSVPDGVATLIVFSSILPFKSQEYNTLLFQPAEPDHVLLRRHEYFGYESKFSPLGNGNYLIRAQRLLEQESHTTWKERTPPYVPPTHLLTTVEKGRQVDSVGGPLLPFDEHMSPRDMFDNLNRHTARDFMGFPEPIKVDLHDRRMICYDFLENVQQSTDCPNVFDAQLQYPNWAFVEQNGRLKRHISFSESEPWFRLDEGDWAKGAYNET